MLQRMHVQVVGFIRGLVAPLAAVALTACLLTLGACAGRQASQGEMIDAYRAGRYPESLAKAEDVAQNSSGLQRDRAALIAGQSAHALGRKQDAEKWLRPLTSHADGEINGNANATLGLIAMNDRNYASASVMLTAAAGRLTGNDAARSAMYAGDCYEQLGQTTKARSAYQQAAQLAQDATLKRSAQERLTQGRYVIQLGALSNRDAAEKLAKQFASNASRSRLPSPQVTPSARSGSMLWTVTIGPFASRPAAEAAKAQAGLPGSVMSMDR